MILYIIDIVLFFCYITLHYILYVLSQIILYICIILQEVPEL